MIKNCLARIGCLTLVVLLLGGAWIFRDDIAGWWKRLEISRASEPSEELALAAERKLEELARGESPRRVRLTQAELQSLITYRLGPHLVDGVETPVVEIGDTSVLVSALVRPERLGGVASKEILQQFLTDSATVTAEVVPGLSRPGVGELRVVALQAGAFPVPTVMVPWVLSALRLPEVAESSGAVLLVPLPPHVTGLAVRSREIVFETGEKAAGG